MTGYNLSTRERIGDINRGLKVHTTVLANTTYMIQTQQEMFNVFGRIKVLSLYGEIIVAMSATATTLKFNCTWTTPTIAAANLTAASGSLTGQLRGVRVYCVGGAVATAAVFTPGAGISDIEVAPVMIGLESGVGSIGILTAGANATSGTTRFQIEYVPQSDGAYVTAVH